MHEGFSDMWNLGLRETTLRAAVSGTARIGPEPVFLSLTPSLAHLPAVMLSFAAVDAVPF